VTFEVSREAEQMLTSASPGPVDNRFAGMRLEDLQGEILSLSKDQHGCRYLQKKLEEEVPEHRDMIFRETYGHFPELMTGKRQNSGVFAKQKTLLTRLERLNQTPLATTSAKSFWNTLLRNSETSSANLLPMILSESR
jgi:hypothetical protein